MNNCPTCNSDLLNPSIGCLFKLKGECVYYTGQPFGSELQPGDNLDDIIYLIFQKLSGTTTSTSTTSTSTSTTSTTTTTTTTTTETVFDTQLVFTSSTYDFQEGVSGQSISTDPVLKLEFNKILVPTGLYNTMTISVGGNPALQINYRMEYLGEAFRFTNTNGDEYMGVFNNNINF